MSRIRYLKPDFFKDEDLADLPIECRLFYAGLWCFADKAGRIEDRPARLKAEIFPYENINCEEILKILAMPKKSSGRPFIQRYEVEGNKFIQILCWDKHQKPHHTEKDTVFPTPPDIIIDYSNDLKSNIKDIKENTIDSFVDSIKNLKKKIKINQLEASAPLSNGCLTVNKPLNSVSIKDFNDLWMSYPRKDGKKRALSSFLSTVKNVEDLSKIRQALSNYLQTKAVKDGFIKNGSTWFSQWQDFVDFVEPKTKKELDDERDKLCFRSG